MYIIIYMCYYIHYNIYVILPKLLKDINLQIQEVEWNLNSINPKKSTLRNIIVKFLKAMRNDNLYICKEKTSWMTAYFSSETTEAESGINIFQMPKEKNWKPRVIYQVKTSLQNEGEIKRYLVKENQENLSQTYLSWKNS